RSRYRRIPMVWSGGCDGVVTPHATVFVRNATSGPASASRMAIGAAMSAELLPEDIGRPAMMEKVAKAVKAAMRDAGVSDPSDVHSVRHKTPFLPLAGKPSSSKSHATTPLSLYSRKTRQAKSESEIADDSPADRHRSRGAIRQIRGDRRAASCSTIVGTMARGHRPRCAYDRAHDIDRSLTFGALYRRFPASPCVGLASAILPRRCRCASWPGGIDFGDRAVKPRGLSLV